MTYDMQVTAKDMANYYRNLVATGWAQDKNGYAPTAKAMNALEYDCDTAGAHAQTQADFCAAASYNPNAGYVLSSYKTKNYNLPEDEVLRQAMTTWFGQLKRVDLDEKATYSNDIQANAPDFANLMIGATKLGCSVKTCLREGFSVAVCEFDGTTPSVGDPLYTVGNTCSGCTAANKKCHKALKGLCA
ncbi:SCP-like protein [Ancylostoma ceylanicum]|uniref:SCP-like protein n=1 Tax=Ancylostoma ceylanicum TaxID=53326 RepID=A0A0D6LG62_9BILA|nr:SCP-like protein [Ancylostoma ceylanicum]